VKANPSFETTTTDFPITATKLIELSSHRSLTNPTARSASSRFRAATGKIFPKTGQRGEAESAPCLKMWAVSKDPAAARKNSEGEAAEKTKEEILASEVPLLKRANISHLGRLITLTTVPRSDAVARKLPS